MSQDGAHEPVQEPRVATLNATDYIDFTDYGLRILPLA
jgi:hypothetical protein